MTAEEQATRDRWRETLREDVLERVRGGMRPLQAIRAVREEMRKTQGAGPQWALILEILLELLPVILQLFGRGESHE